MIVTEYELLVCLAEELNMRKSAEKLFLSQPALSQRLQTIESRWNTKIFYSYTKRAVAYTRRRSNCSSCI